MKRYKLIFLFLVISTAFGFQAGDADKIVGVWKSPDGSYMIKIDKLGDHFQGRIVWMSSTDQNNMKLDVNNPNEQLRNLPLKGNKIIDGLTYNLQDSNWADGTFYSFAEGKVYNCQISRLSSNQIKILKYIRNQQEGIAETWTRQQ